MGEECLELFFGGVVVEVFQGVGQPLQRRDSREFAAFEQRVVDGASIYFWHRSISSLLFYFKCERLVPFAEYRQRKLAFA